MQEIIGKGNTAEVFPYKDGKVCKLFFEGYPHEYVEQEFQNAREFFQNGIRVPIPFEVVVIQNRSGIIYERIQGKTLLAAMEEHKESFPKFLKMFVELQKNIHLHRSRNVLSYKSYLLAVLQNHMAATPAIIQTIQALPESDCLLHGDFHPNNILIQPDGTPVVIDFMNVCCGPPLYDIARTYFLIRQFQPWIADEYRKQINVPIGKLVDYLRIIEFYRKYES